MLENKLFEALLDVVPFKAYAIDIKTYEVVYANKLMRENMYAPQERYCWENVFGQNSICSWCSVNKLQQRDKKESKEKYICEFFDETDDRWLKSYDELMNWPDGREVKYSILVDITDQKEIQGDMIKSHAKLAMHSKQLKVTNKNLQITKLQLQKTVNELEEQTQKAQLATTYKSQFLANMSHEIRTPMNAVMGMTYLLGQTNLDAKQKDYVKKIDVASKNLLNIINDILDFSKIEAGKLELEAINFELEDVILNVRDIVEHKAIEKGLDFKIIYNQNTKDTYFGDPLRIGQILVNLLNNAIKFTQTGMVELSISSLQKDKILFEIKDTGIGLSAENIGKLFESFTQADISTTRKFGGTGLGLSISRQLAYLMDGDIHIESELEVGSNFMVELYLPKGDALKVDKSKKEIFSKVGCLEFQGSHIMLVDDNKINQEIVISLIEGLGIGIDIANNGFEAVSLYLQNPKKYNLIFMDLYMPLMDGFEATKKIRELNKDIPVVALTANAMVDDLKATKEALMDDHLTKPIEVEKFYTVLNKYLSKKVSFDKLPLDNFTLQSDIPHFVSIDTAKGISSLNGNRKGYLKILKNFYSDYKNLQLDKLEFEELKRTIHTIKGLSGNIGAISLYNKLIEYENNDDNNFLLLSVMDELEKIIGELKSIDSDDNMVCILEKKAIDDIKKNRLLLEYIEAVNSKKPKNIDEIIEKIKQYDLGEEDNVLFQKSIAFVLEYNFYKALEVFEEKGYCISKNK
jgi:signal transduction histidine kinase/CheY-like chemotaxis protein/HPt (histidine-containing phosphotransfer) domain-containing protein